MSYNKLFFKFGFIVLLCIIAIDAIFAVTVTVFNNPFGFSWHPEFYIGLLLGITFFSTAYIGWIKKDE